jgi:hypothetical protein
MELSNIVKVYNGRIGCMCGCLGKYSYTQDGATNYGPGYDVQDSVNERSVKIIANKVINNPNAKWDDTAEFVYVEDRVANKIQVVYFKKNG